MKTIWIDVETTGIDHDTNVIIELAALYENDGADKSVFHVYILPEYRPDDFNTIEELTGITWEYLQQNGISEAEAYNKFIEWINQYIDNYDKSDKAIFAAYNARFDNDYMRDFFTHNNDSYFGSWFYSASLDIMGTAILMVRLGYIDPPVNFKNTTICELFGIVNKKSHSALEDIKASRLAQLEMERLLNE